jgi:hypothetical protein
MQANPQQPCSVCRQVDYVPGLSTVTGTLKVAVGSTGAGIFGAVAGAAKLGATILDVAGNQQEAQKWQALSGRACCAATGGLKLAGRGAVSVVPIIGNGILLAVDCTGRS